MIRLILGGVGSGKTVSAVKMVLSKDEHVFGNFYIRHKNFTRLRHYHIFIEKELDDKGKRKKLFVNWDYWKEQIDKRGGFHIFIDEMHNLMHSRRAMSNQNIVLSTWISQIRKVTGSNEMFDLVCVSQELERIDVAVRDLAHEIILCEKFETNELIPTIVRKHGRLVQVMLPKTYIMLTYFCGTGCVMRYSEYRYTFKKRLRSLRTYFVANPYFQYYDSYELISFGETEFL